MESKAPQWIKNVEKALARSTHFPALQTTPLFPWEALAEKIAHILQVDKVQITSGQPSVREEKEVLQGMGESPICSTFELSPLQGHVHFILPSSSATLLLNTCLKATNSEGSVGKKWQDSSIQEGFYQYFLLKVLQEIDKLQFLKRTALQLVSNRPLPSKETICIDITISIEQQTIYGRLVLDRPFLVSFDQHKPAGTLSPLSSEMAQSLGISMQMQVGRVSLNAEEWMGIKEGDFIILDECGYDVEKKAGSITFFLENTPLMRGRIKPEGIKILDYILYAEEEEIDMRHPDESPEEFDSENILQDEEKEPKNDEEQDDFLGDFTEDEDFEEEETYVPDTNIQNPVEPILSQKNVPIALSIELGKIKLPLKELLEIRPGTVLDLNVRPEKGVEIRANGSLLARGELIQLGETLGVRILEIENS